jgi:RNA polymerase sigma-70 factor, ECF subfamily
MMDADASHRELGLYLHRQLLAGDPTATARIAEAFLPYVESRLGLRFPRLDDPHLVQTAIVDAILNYFQRPGQFNPDKSSLRAYLYMSARGDLLNALERTRAEPQKVNLVEDVEVEDGEAEKGVEVPALYDLEEEVLARSSPVSSRLDTLFPDAFDRKLVELMLDAERDTREFAAVLGIQGRPTEEQAKIVKRHKDRLKKMMQRHQTELLKDE